MTEQEYDDAGFVVSSEYRSDVLFRLHESPAMPSTIAEESGHAIAHVSRTLGKLRERDLVELLVSEDRKKGRVYGITDRGEACLDALETMGVDA